MTTRMAENRMLVAHVLARRDRAARFRLISGLPWVGPCTPSQTTTVEKRSCPQQESAPPRRKRQALYTPTDDRDMHNRYIQGPHAGIAPGVSPCTVIKVISYSLGFTSF